MPFYTIYHKTWFELGGKNKKQKQLEGAEKGYEVKDDIKTGYSNVTPLTFVLFMRYLLAFATQIQQLRLIIEHLLYNSGELDRESTCSILEHMGNDGKQKYITKYDNIDVSQSVGYRINSKNATLSDAGRIVSCL